MLTSEALRLGMRLIRRKSQLGPGGWLSLLGPLVLLVACVGFGEAEGDAPREIQVTSDAVTITGPRGFCVDPGSTRTEGDTAFVLLGNCAAISGQARARQPDIPAVLTGAVAARSEGGTSLTDTLEELEGFFRSDAGRSLLSRSGDPSSVTILEARISGNMFLLHARDTSAGSVMGVAQDYWRAYMDLGPRLATLSVLALADQDVSDNDALATLMAFAQAVQGANTDIRTGTNAAQLPQGTAQDGIGLFRGGVFQRIFR